MLIKIVKQLEIRMTSTRYFNQFNMQSIHADMYSHPHTTALDQNIIAIK